ncbi:hypothetical protein FACS1894110_15540 [Spirochaetia bacterium]|nr:hypothetical protein FACS1894110_15540 [Spirochaetia bacterium]
MIIEQTVEIPASKNLLRKGGLTVDVPRDIPSPAEAGSWEDIGMDGECPLDHTPNAETAAAIREGRAMMRGEIPSPTFHSLEELLADLRS